MVSMKRGETPHPRSLLSVLIGDVIDICYFLTPLVISYHVGWFVIRNIIVLYAVKPAERWATYFLVEIRGFQSSLIATSILTVQYVYFCEKVFLDVQTFSFLKN